jgi:hypothetical protein
MKPIMNLYSDKVTITDKKELLPFAKCNDFVVAGKNGIIYSSVSKEVLEEIILERMPIQPELALLKLAIDLSDEVKVIPDLKIIDDKVSIMATEQAEVLMTNSGFFNLCIVECYGKIYTNNVKVANLCIQHDLDSRDPETHASATLLKMLIGLKGGLVECELKVM